MISRPFLFSQKYSPKTCTVYMFSKTTLTVWHHVSVVNHYVDIESELSMTTMTCCQWLRETVLLWKKVQNPMKNLTKSVIWYFRRWLRGNAIIELWDRISLQKQRSSQNRFCLLWGPSRIFLVKNGQKSCDTVPLIISNYKKDINTAVWQKMGNINFYILFQ